MQCPCQSGHAYQACCAIWHGGGDAPTAEALMRSRYSAFALNKPAYLYRSWSAQTRPSKQSLKKAELLKWLGLEIVRTERGGVLDDTGMVVFIARYKDEAKGGNQMAQLHEASQFSREKGRWVYVGGQG